MPETPEQKARREIDADLAAAGWIVQDRVPPTGSRELGVTRWR